MARIIFEYDQTEPQNVEVELDINDGEEIEAVTLIEILGTGVNAVIRGCWEDKEIRERVAVEICKMILGADNYDEEVTNE